MALTIFKNILKGIAVLFISVLIFLAILGGYLAGSMLKVAGESPEFDTGKLLSGLKENSKIVDKNGTLIEQIETEEYREIVPYEQMPQYLIDAFVSAEDKRFFEHDGIDFFGILSSLYGFVKNGDMRGASTLTQQLVRNVYLNNDVNWKRKIQEIYMSLLIEDELTDKLGKEEAKKTIIESYLNRVFFGQNAYGVQAASHIYFSKDVSELDLAQAATLAGVVQAPSNYALYSTYRPSQVTNERILGETTINGERYLAVYNPGGYARSEYVLEQMLKNGYINDLQFKQAMDEDVSATIKPPAKRADNLSTYITDVVRENTLYILMDTLKLSRADAIEKMNYGGLTITSTIDLDLQRKLEQRLATIDEVMYIDGEEYAPKNLDLYYDDYGNITNKDGYLQYYDKDNLMTQDNRIIIPESQHYFTEDGSLVITQGRIKAYDGYLDVSDFFSIDGNGILRTHRVGTIPLDANSYYINENDEIVLTKDFLSSGTSFYESMDDGSIAINKEYYLLDEVGVIQPQVAVSVIDTRTGELKAIVGGRELDSRHFLNRASSYPRQPGSSFKPIAVYAAVLGQGNNLGSAMDDTPFEMLEDEYGDKYPWPQNVDRRFRGLTPVIDALRLSLNTVTVKWLDKIGLDVGKEYLARFGIINRKHPERDNFVEANEDPDHNDDNFAMALGAMTNGLTTLDMASAYQAIGNNGKHIEKSSVAKIEDNNGNVLYENPRLEEEVLPPEVNYQLIMALDEVVTEGFASDYLEFEGRSQFVGKTGTTDDNTDFWFAGTSPYFSTAVWIGSDNAFLTLYGNSALAARVYQAVSDIVHENTEPIEFARPDGLYEVEVCTLSGKLATDLCRQDPRGVVKTILVSKQTEPKETCDLHVVASVDIRNNLLASEVTPNWAIASRIFTRRTTPYYPSEFNYITPEDWKYEVPTVYSTLVIPPPKKETKPDGTTIDESTDQNGNKTVIEVKPDGTKTTTIYDVYGNVVSTTTVKPEPKPDQSSQNPGEHSTSPSSEEPPVLEDPPQEDGQ